MGESYNHRDDPGIMLKLYPLDWTRLAEKEYDRARKAITLGVPTPDIWTWRRPSGSGRYS